MRRYTSTPGATTVSRLLAGPVVTAETASLRSA